MQQQHLNGILVESYHLDSTTIIKLFSNRPRAGTQLFVGVALNIGMNVVHFYSLISIFACKDQYCCDEEMALTSVFDVVL